MNKHNVRPRRSNEKESPLSKRPKLDFTIRARESPRKSSSRESPKKHNGSVKEKSVGSNFISKKNNENLPTGSDWDDDFSGDMLEKVCLIADLSQAMVTTKATPEKDEKKNEDTIDKNLSHNLRSRVIPLNIEPKNPKEELEKLRVEFEKLQEKFKTKEGEVHILRSQLKQNEDAKQAVALLNIKTIEDLQKKYNEKISLTEKELETTKSKLHFKDLEYKTLSERCRQLEYTIHKSKSVENQGDEGRNFGEMSQAVLPKTQVMEVDNVGETSKQEASHFSFKFPQYHEGKALAKLLCPEFFKFKEEPSVVPFYNFQSDVNSKKLEFDKKEKYKWKNLPKENSFVKDLYNSVTSLFIHESFLHKESKEVILFIFKTCKSILVHTKEVLLFLENVQLESTEYDDPDQLLLENENEVKVVTVKDLLDGESLNEEECGIESRRALALVCSLIKVSKISFDLIKKDQDFFKLLKDIATSIGNLRRPLCYSGLLIGICFILQRELEEMVLEKNILFLINEIVEEIIFARPKLNVLIEVVNILTAGKNHLDFLQALCRKASVESCALFMDSKLKQAMFFTKDACPLKLLFMQIMGLACMPSSQSIRCDVANCVIKWLNNSINNFDSKALKWLPTNTSLSQRDRCFNVTECLLHMLTLCLKDYNYFFPPEDGESTCLPNPESDFKKHSLISIIGHGAVLLKRILKADQKQLHDNTYSLRFANMLKAFMPSKSQLCHTNHASHLSSVQIEAIFWITDLLENDLRNQDCSFKQNTSTLSDVDLLNSLKITDETKIY